VTANNVTDVISEVIKYSARPRPFEPGESRFWDDPHISKGMLAAHLDPYSNTASRKHATIDEDVANLLSSGFLKPGERVLDLGCGPGLYCSRLARRGLEMTGVDISQRSLDYARQYAEENGLEINYRLMNFFDIDFSVEFDAVLQTHGELNTFSDDKINELLARLHRALRPGGLLIFDSTTRAVRMKAGLSNRWYTSAGGYWRPGPHLVLEQGFDYAEDDVWLDQYIVIDGERTVVYRNWFHDYTIETIRTVLENAGFEIVHVWNNMIGTPYEAGGDNMAIVARKTT
jgi:2-polyprenyl-3-methyl-5-hydroxy-6-metoxy-1,4-benzoquinol methylase